MLVCGFAICTDTSSPISFLFLLESFANILVFILSIMRKKKKNCWYSMAEMCEITSLSPEGQEVVFCMKYRKKIFFTWSICKSKPSGVIKSVTDLYFSPSQLRSKKTCPEFHLFSTFYLRSWVLYTQFNKFESSFICQSTPLFAISLKDIGIFLLSVQDNNIGLNVLIIKHK